METQSIEQRVEAYNNKCSLLGIRPLTLKIDGNDVIITESNQNLSETFIPKFATVIGEESFMGETLTKIEIPENIKSIHRLAFRECIDLKELILGNSLSEIEEKAFYMCKQLKSISIPNSVRLLGARAFMSCNKLEQVNLGAGIKTIEQETFRNCGKIKEIIIPENIKEIEHSAFSGCLNLKTVKILGDKIIKFYAFAWSGVEEVYIKSDKVKIYDNAFMDCIHLKEVILDCNEMEIGAGTNLESIQPNGRITVRTREHNIERVREIFKNLKINIEII